MTSTSELGISPVLLQAITQTLSTNSTSASSDNNLPESSEGVSDGATQHVIVSCQQGEQTIKLENSNHILHGMNEPVATLSGPQGDTIVVVQNMEVENSENVEPEVERQDPQEQVIVKTDPGQEGEMPQQIIVKHVTPGSSGEDIPVSASVSTQGLNMGSVLSAIASHLQKSRKRSSAALSEPETSMELQGSGGQQPPVVLSFASSNSVPSPANDITVSEVDNVITETVVHTVSSSDFSHESRRSQEILPDSTQDESGTTTLVLNSDGLPEGTMFEMIQTDQGLIRLAQIQQAESCTAEQLRGPCPICGDKISGYHYGIFSCESCKGFFKRTVQNKKAFICHRKGECDVNMTNRKKCPACRFKRCLVAGMKLEAIRGDRTRGGRSSYDGCSPHGKLGKAQTPKSASPGPQVVGELAKKVYQICDPASGQVHTISEDHKTVLLPSGSDQIVAVVSMEEGESSSDVPKMDLSTQVQPQTPQVLEDLLAVECLVTEDEGEPTCCEGKLREGDQDLFSSLLHLADHCLYKIVRWARNLPDFANLSTDDQILLLQNAWAELLCISSCWHSVRGSDVLLLMHGRVLNLDMAKAMGFADIIQRLLDFTEQLKRLEVDAHEFVAMKVLLLMTPDVEGLKHADILHEYQDRIAESLMLHTSTHYAHKPNKYVELIARLPELSRTCVIAKERLTARQAAGEVPQFSLLSELLKGDIVVQPLD